MNHSRATSISVLLATVTGIHMAQAYGFLQIYWSSNQMPTSMFFRIGMFGFWLPVVVLLAWAGIVAALRIATGKRKFALLLYLLAVGYTLVIEIDGYALGWSFFRVYVSVPLGPVGVGINGIGFVFLLWLSTVVPLSRDKASSQDKSTAPGVAS